MDNENEQGARDGELLLPVTVGGSDHWLPGLAEQLIEQDVGSARRYVEASKSAATLRAYRSDWAIYVAWCSERGFEALPSMPQQVALFLSAEAARGRASSTVERRLAAIGYHHRIARHPAPTAMTDSILIEEIMSGIRRLHGAGRKKKKAATHDLIRSMLDAIPETGLRNLRDRALISWGLASAMRRSEISALRLEHMTRTDDGVRVLIPKSKTDQEGVGRTIAVPRGLRIRPLALLETWLAAAQVRDGAVFRRMYKGDTVSEHPMTGEAIAMVLKERAVAVGLDEAEFGAHSMRAGFLTSAAATGANIFKMRAQSGHESLDVLAGYIRDADLFKDHAGAGFL